MAYVRETRRDQILHYMAEFIKEHHNAPSTLEIARHFCIAQQTAYSHVVKLMAERRLEQVDGRWKIPHATYEAPENL